MLVNPDIFKAYDIRGVYGRDFDDDLAYAFGLAYVELKKTDADYQTNRPLQIAVGSDMRLSSPALKIQLIRGLIAAGADVIDIGLVSTPSFYFAVSHYGYDGGVTVSASHNPKDWNGFKLVRAQGVPISGETGIDFIKEKIMTGGLQPAARPGKISQNDQTVTDEIAYALSKVDITKIKPLKIVIDTANGMGITYLKPLLEKLPVKFTAINAVLDGSFPGHEADPFKEENLVQLKQAVLEQKADLGLTTDGDADRIFFVDDQGQALSPALVRGLLAQIFLKDKPGAKIGYDVRPGKITTDMIEAAGGIPVLTRVGHSLIKEQMIKEDIYFAGESSGHFFFNDPRGCFEYPCLMILKLLAAFSAANQSVSAYIAPYEKYYASGEINRTVADQDAVLQKIADQYKSGQINRLDGISVTYPDFWFNVRASNTEPLIRLNLEAVSREIMEQKCQEVLNLIK